MDAPQTSPRLNRRRSAANIDRCERKRCTGEGTRAAYSARRANRAERCEVRATLRSLCN